jgi:hypothetical protein
VWWWVVVDRLWEVNVVVVVGDEGYCVGLVRSLSGKNVLVLWGKIVVCMSRCLSQCILIGLRGEK